MSRLLKYYGVNYKKGDVIFEEGDAADSLFMIHKGKVQINKGAGVHDEMIQVLGEGEFLGEMAVINSMPRSATAVAVEDSELIRMDTESFQKTIGKNHDFAISVINFLSSRLRETDELVSILARRDKNNRLLITILQEMITHGKKDNSSQWMLLDLDSVTKRAASRYSRDDKTVKKILSELSLENRITVKKDQSGREWVAWPLS